MKCKEIEKYLPLYPDDVDSDIREEISRHLQTCDKCRELAGKLSLYSNYAESAEEEEPPEGFERKVLERLPAERQFIPKKRLYVRFGWAVSSAAAFLIAFLLFYPDRIPTQNIIETNFALKQDKKSKGPSALVDFKEIANAVEEIITATGAEVKDYNRNSVTGYYDYIMIGVPKGRLPEFVEKFNGSSAIPISLPKRNDAAGDEAYMKIYFDMVNFAVGDFDGDKHADIVARFISGKYKGKWVLYKNGDSVRFVNYSWLKVGDGEKKYLGDYWLISGDFDGDDYDDICLYEYGRPGGLTLHTLLNDHDGYFRDIPGYFKSLSVPTEGEFVKLIAGDADGDGKDDLIWIAKINEDTYRCTALNINRSFRPVSLTDLEHSGGVILAGDLNGDKYFDLCIKYPGRSRGGETDILLNNHDFTFAGSYAGRLSFQGEYSFWCADYDADGFDDLIVKSGGPFLSGGWYALINNLKGDFYREGKQFNVTYPSAAR